jgi:hypothetical protein
MTLEGGDHSEDHRMGPLAIAAADAALHFFDLTLQGDDAAADRLARTPGVEHVQEQSVQEQSVQEQSVQE